MGSFTIVTDSNADFVPGYTEERGIPTLPLTYTLEGKTCRNNDPDFPIKTFYARMRSGHMPKTAAVNPEEAIKVFRELLEAGQDILSISFSSALSGTYNNVRLAAEELRERYPQHKIIAIDSLCASSGQALLITRAVEYREEGLSLEETAQRVREDIPHMAHLFTVDDLFHLHRGGRVSAASAVVGSMLGIKPVLHMDDEGRLIPTSKVRGRKQSLLALVDGMARQMDPGKCKRFFISHGDCLEDAQFVADEVIKRFQLEEHRIAYVGPTIGAHSGPGTVALFFYAKLR